MDLSRRDFGKFSAALIAALGVSPQDILSAPQSHVEGTGWTVLRPPSGTQTGDLIVCFIEKCDQFEAPGWTLTREMEDFALVHRIHDEQTKMPTINDGHAMAISIVGVDPEQPFHIIENKDDNVTTFQAMEDAPELDENTVLLATPITVRGSSSLEVESPTPAPARPAGAP